MKVNEHYQFHPILILRTPVCSYQDYREMKMEDLLQDEYFRRAIGYASENVLQLLEKAGFDSSKLNGKLWATVKKYHNRMCYRPTPFGFMAGLSPVAYGKEAGAIIVGDKKKIHLMPSFRLSVLKGVASLTNADPSINLLQSNNSTYKVGIETRYLRYEADYQAGKRSFLIDAAECSELLDKVLQHGREPRSKKAMIDFIAASFNASPEESAAFVEDLLEKQLLRYYHEPNISGEDYYQRMNTLSASVDEINIPENAASAYINLERPDVTGAVDETLQQKIREGLYAMDRLVAYRPLEQIKTFKEAFVQKFDMEWVPLLEALDPETGVGYHSLAGPVHYAVLIKGINASRGGTTALNMEWSPVHAYLMQKWTDSIAKGAAVLRLTTEELELLPQAENEYKLPPSISIMFRLKDEQLYLESAGSASAVSLIGRFTIFNQAFQQIASDIAQEEEKANPGVTFAEIAHFSNLHTANIERRAAIRKYEIPILTGSVYDEEHRLPLSDLWIAIKNDQLVLYSAKLQKRVIPRLSTALNYHRSDLAVFRLLCDLQHQGIKSNFNFELASFFPGQLHYPRVEYNNVILQLATWHIKKEQVKKVRAKDKQSLQQAILRLSKELHWPRFISINQHDNQLVFDLQHDEDLLLLSDFFKEGKELTIKEFPFVDETTAAVANPNHRPYINQFITSLYHTQQVYHTSTGTGIGKKAQRKFIPGSEWLYFKIYCLPMRANEILTRHIVPLIEALQSSGSIRQYFFIRYNDPSPHIRLRFLLNSDNDEQKITAQLQQGLYATADAGLISKVMLDTYERELERYSPELIDIVEESFCGSSALVLAFLSHVTSHDNDYSYYQVAFAAVHIMMDIFGYALADRIEFFEQLYFSFAGEFKSTASLKEQVTAKYRELSKWEGFEQLFSFDNVPELAAHMNTFIATNKAIAEKIQGRPFAKIYKLISSLIHMHLNRVFTDMPRTQEMVIYFCLWRYYFSAQARSRHESVLQAV